MGVRRVSKDKIAATGMALLPFLAAGETHKYGKKYKKTVENGLNWLTNRVGGGGGFAGSNNMYAHAIATVALCEAAGMTRDPAVKAKAALAVNYILGAQGKNGSWGYNGPDPSEGDTSIVGWQIQALASARLAEIKFDKDKVYKDANKFLESVSDRLRLDVRLPRTRQVADADPGRPTQPVLHGRNEPAAPRLRPGRGLPQAVPAAEGLRSTCTTTTTRPR